MSGEPAVTLQRADSSVWLATFAASSRRLWRGFVNSVYGSTICRALQEVCQCCSRHNILILLNAKFCATVAPHTFLKNRTYCAGEDHDSRNGGRWKRRRMRRIRMRRTRCAGPVMCGQMRVGGARGDAAALPVAMWRETQLERRFAGQTEVRACGKPERFIQTAPCEWASAASYAASDEGASGLHFWRHEKYIQ